MSRLTDLSLANRSLVALATVIIAVAGMISALTLKQELVPNLQFPVVAVATSVPGADASVVDSQVTRPIETAAQGLDGVQKVLSTSSTGHSSVTVRLDYGTDVKAARAELQSMIAGLSGLPSGTNPRVVAGNVDDFPVIQLAAIPPQKEAAPAAPGEPDQPNPAQDAASKQFADALSTSVIPKINKIDGVRDVQLSGADTQQVTITLDQAKAAAAGVTMQSVQAALASNGVAVPAGSVTRDANALNVQVGGPFATVEEIAAIPLLGAVPANVTAGAPPRLFTPGPNAQLPTSFTANAPVRVPMAPARTDCTPNAQMTVNCTVTCVLTPEEIAAGQTTCSAEYQSPTAQSQPPVTATVTLTPTSTAGPAATVTTTQTLTQTQTATATKTVQVPTYVTVPAPAAVPPKTPPPTLGSVATVALSDAPLSGYTRTDGKPSLNLGVRRSADGNTVAISDELRSQLTDYEKSTGGRFTVVYDQAPYIKQSIHGLTTEGLLGLGFAVLVVLAFLLSLRMTLVTAISIPLSLLIALIGLKVGGYSLNILTLGALTIAVGRVVDDSIVVVENIKRHMDAGEDKLVAIPTAVREVAGAITSSTLATAAVFLPIAVVGGQVGVLFRPFAVTVVLALLASLIVALTIVPVLAYWFIEKKLTQQGAEAGRRRRFGRKSGAVPQLTPKPPQQPVRPVRMGPDGTPTQVISLPAEGADQPPAQSPGQQPTQQPTQPPTQQPGRPATPPPSAPATVEQPVVPPSLPVGETSVMPAQPSARPNRPAATPSAGASATLGATPAKTTPTKTTPGSTGPGKTGRGKTGPNKPPKSPKRRQEALRRGYLATLRAALAKPILTLLLATVVLGATAAAATQLKTDFLGGTGQDTVVINQQLPAGSSLEATDLAAQKVEKVLADRKDVAHYQVNVGESADQAAAFTGAGGDNSAQYYVSLAESADADTVTTELRRNLATRPELGSFTVGGGDPTQSEAVEVAVQANDAEKLKVATDRVYAQVSKLPGATEVTNNLAEAVPSVKVSVNRTAAAAAGLTEAGIGEAVAAALRGDPVGKVGVGDDSYGAVVLAPTKPMTPDELRTLPVGNTTLGAVAAVNEVQTPTTIQRVDGERTATISAAPADADLGGFTRKVTDAVRASNLPAGSSATIGGASADQREAFSALGWALLAAIALVYLVMVATFRSLVQPLLLLTSVPFAATGAVALLLITGVPLGVAGIIGLLMLVGIVVTNAIVLIDLVNTYRRRGMGVKEAILEGGGHRLRPILMTALATVFALVPMALSLTDGGAFISQPLALVVIGGLITSTLLTLVIVPVLYYLVEGRAERRAERKTRQKDKASKTGRAGRAGRAGKSGTGDQAAQAPTKAPAKRARPAKPPKPPREPKPKKPRTPNPGSIGEWFPGEAGAERPGGATPSR